MQSKPKFIFKVVVMGFALYGAIHAMVYFRSPEFITSVATMMGALPPPPPLSSAQNLSWCENKAQPQFWLDGKIISNEQLCDLKIESYKNSLLENANFNSKLDAKVNAETISTIQADLNLGLFKYKDIVFSSALLFQELKKSLVQK